MAARRSRNDTQKNLDIFYGRFWPHSWIGPTVAPGSEGYSEKMGHLERVFQSANILRECACNWRDGLISEPFTWHLKGQDGQRADSETDTTAAEAEQELQRWLDWVGEQAIAADPASTNFEQSDPWAEFILSLGVLGEGSLRLWQPERYADDPDPIHKIHLHAPKAGSVTIERSDADGFIDEIRYSYGRTGDERHRMDGGSTTISIASGDDDNEPLAVATGGRWLIQHATGDSVFTPSVKRLQNALNHALTMMVRNSEIAGFREKVFANAELPVVTDDQGNPLKDANGHPVELQRGPGIDLYLSGYETELAGGGRGIAPVTIHESQPVDNASLEAAIETYRRLIYMQFSQGHLLSAGDGSLSGESRIQMRGQFELNLKGWKRRIESAIAAILNIVLRLLGYETYEVVVGLTITTGKLSAEERAQIISEYQAGLMSRATAIAKLGTVADVDAELALMAEELAEQGAARDDDPELPRQPRPTEEPDDDDPE